MMISAEINTDGVSDEDIVKRVLSGEGALFEVLMRRYNQRIYRIARAILRDESEAEDVMQDAYVRAYTHLDQFAGLARFSTWLTRIAVNEALVRVRRRSRLVYVVAAPDPKGDSMSAFTSKTRDPEQQALNRELSSVLEAALDSLTVRFSC